MSESTNNHTPRAADGNNAVAEDVNQPLRQLDFAIGLHNLTATANPTTAANSAAGYTTGRSLWFNTSNGSLWLCTNAAVGTWQQISLGGAVAGHTHAATDIISGLLTLLVGGTGADLSATGPGVVVQDSLGGVLASRPLAAGDLPAASTTSQGAVELATGTEAIDGLDATRAVTPVALAATLAQALSDIAVESTFISQSSGSSDAGKKIKLDSSGKIDFSMLDANDVVSILKLVLLQQGDLLVRNNLGDLVRRPIGAQGQVLSVDLAQPSGFSYISPVTSGSGIPVSTVNQKGDLLVGTANDTVVRFPVGATGRVLAANSGTPEGIEWLDANSHQLLGQFPIPESTVDPMPVIFSVSSSVFSLYKKLVLVGYGQVTLGTGSINWGIRLNGQTTGYTWNSALNNGSTLAASEAAGGSGTYIPVALSYAQTSPPMVSFEFELFFSVNTGIVAGPDFIFFRGDVEERASTTFQSRQVRGHFETDSLTQVSIISSFTGTEFTGEARLYGVN